MPDMKTTESSLTAVPCPSEKMTRLRSTLREIGSAAVAFSAGVDSTFLLRVAHEELGDRVVAVTVRSSTFPRRELDEAVAFCRAEGIRHEIIDTSELDVPGFAENPPDRCYLCKKSIFGEIMVFAQANGFAAVLEGSNMDDDGDYRPGMRAIKELGVKSPLHDAGLTKAEIRALSREMGLPTAEKPSYACLASRFGVGARGTRRAVVARCGAWAHAVARPLAWRSSPHRSATGRYSAPCRARGRNLSGVQGIRLRLRRARSPGLPHRQPERDA